MKEEIIKSCPFCGGTEVEIARTNENACWVECNNTKCNASTASRKSRHAAINVWNKRYGMNSYTEATIVYDMDKEWRMKK